MIRDRNKSIDKISYKYGFNLPDYIEFSDTKWLRNYYFSDRSKSTKQTIDENGLAYYELHINNRVFSKS